MMRFCEDNESTICIIRTGKNPTMRHISRTHGVNIGWLHDVFQQPYIHMEYVVTTLQRADIFTKAFTGLVK